jgi:hypothetical protein
MAPSKALMDVRVLVRLMLVGTVSLCMLTGHAFAGSEASACAATGAFNPQRAAQARGAGEFIASLAELADGSATRRSAAN